MRISDQQTLRDYRQLFPKRPPNLENLVYDDELDPLVVLGDDRELFTPPARGIEIGIPPRQAYDDGTSKYLWVVADDAVPLLLEEGPEGSTKTLRRAKHTNLTGGAEAHAGGELWFRDDHSFWMSGASGRYRPRGLGELDTLVQCFTEAGYSVCSFGWEEGVAGPARFLRGVERWT